MHSGKRNLPPFGIRRSRVRVLVSPGAGFMRASQNAPAHLLAPEHPTTGAKFATISVL